MTPVKASSFGRRGRLSPAIPGRPAVAQHLAHRLAGQPEAARRRARAQPLHIHAAPHRCIELHSIHPSCVPQNTLGMLGGPRTRSSFPPPSGRVTPPRCGLVLLRRSQRGLLSRGSQVRILPGVPFFAFSVAWLRAIALMGRSRIGTS